MDVKQETVCQLTKAEIDTAFNFLSAVEVAELAAYLDRRQWPKGAVIMTEGEEGDYMAFLVDGRLAIKKETNFPGKHVLVAILDKGSLVGELSVLEKTTRTATVEAMEPCTMMLLTRNNIDRMIEEKPKLAVQLLKRIIHIVSLRIRKADDRLTRLL